MFESIGIFAVWLVGLAAVYVAPVLLLSAFWREGGLASLIVGAFCGKITVVAYIAATMLYFIYT